MTPYCLIEIKPVDAILSNVRMSWTMDEFYAQGGPTSFIDRVSAALGIHASQMKVVAVYTGSVVVEYELTADEDDTESSSSAQQLRAIETALTEIVESGDDAAAVFGAPVLSASTNGEAVIEDPTYNPAAAPTAPTTPIEEEEETSITVDDEGLQVKVDDTTRNSLIGIFAVLVVVIGCCFGCGVVLVCTYSISKASKEVLSVQQKVAKMQEQKKKGMADASESQIEIDQQYVMPDNMDAEIFTQKKRALKVNDEHVVQTEREDDHTGGESAQRLHGDSNVKLIRAKQTAKTAKNLQKLA